MALQDREPGGELAISGFVYNVSVSASEARLDVAGLTLDRMMWAGLLVVCSALFMDGLDISMVTVALPSISRDLHLGTADLQWIVSAYMLGLGGFLLLGGRAADLLGRRRTFTIALAVFAVASMLGGAGVDGPMLIASRFVKGVAAAFTIPAGLSILTTMFPPGPLRNKALGVYAACGASGFSIGLVLGGLLTPLGWRWTFVAPGPMAVLILVAALRTIRRDPPGSSSDQPTDIAGALTLSGGMLMFVETVVRAPQIGWGNAETIGGLVLAGVLLGAFVVIELTVQRPLIRLGILRSRSLVRANLCAVALNGAFITYQFVMTLYLQTLLHWGPLDTSLAFLPLGLTVAVGAPRMGRVVDRFGTGLPTVAGFIAFVAAYGQLLFRFRLGASYLATLFPTMLMVGLGIALAFPAVNMQAIAGVDDEEQGLASGLVNASLQVGGAVVLAIVTAVMDASTGTARGATSRLSADRVGLAMAAGLVALGLLLAASPLLTRRRVRAA